MDQPNNKAEGARRPAVGLRHYIPLFFLAPTMLMLVHAWNRTAPPEPRLFVEVDTGGFVFPRDIHLELRFGDNRLVPVEGGRGSVPRPDPGSHEVSLHVSRPDGGPRVLVGRPETFSLAPGRGTERWTLRLSAADCAHALRLVRGGG